MSHAHHSHPVRLSAEPHSTELTDPVCGMAVKKTSFHKVEFQGRLYSFCSAHCRSKFIDNPQRYLTGSERAEGDANTEYSCPMHPEVRQLGPGTLPHVIFSSPFPCSPLHILQTLPTSASNFSIRTSAALLLNCCPSSMYSQTVASLFQPPCFLISSKWGLGSNGTESALKPSACPQTLVASG